VFDGNVGGHLWKDNFILKELTENQRQRGDNVWSATLNIIREGQPGGQLTQAIQLLKTRVSDHFGGPAPHGNEWNDAPCLVATTDQQNEYNKDKLHDLEHAGARVLDLPAGHGCLVDGIMKRDAAMPEQARTKIPGDADNCGGLQSYLR
jgi:hypothetical protein